MIPDSLFVGHLERAISSRRPPMFRATFMAVCPGHRMESSWQSRSNDASPVFRSIRSRSLAFSRECTNFTDDIYVLPLTAEDSAAAAPHYRRAGQHHWPALNTRWPKSRLLLSSQAPSSLHSPHGSLSNQDGLVRAEEKRAHCNTLQVFGRPFAPHDSNPGMRHWPQ